MRKLLMLLCLVLSSYLLSAQQTFTIKVTDSKTGNPVTNASATVRATGKGAAGNSDGILKIQANSNDVLEITCVGYKPASVKLAGTSEIAVSLEASSVDLGDIVIIGTRGAARAKTETAVPVDVIRINQVGLPTAKMDLTSVLNAAAPSFNHNKQTGADGADHIDLGTLRGLGPDQTLVLINGKRRHQTAFVGLFGTRGKGSSGTDLNAFTQSAVDRLEILRDGASAQYGSDAMAGVINVLLKKDVNHWTINTGWSGYYDTKYNAADALSPTDYQTGNKIDGQTFSFSVNNGLSLGKKGGFINLSFDYLDQGKTSRQVRDLSYMDGPDALDINRGRRGFGDGSVQTDGAMYNMELPLGDLRATFYSFGGYNHKASDAFAYSRNLSWGTNRFPIDNSGNPIYVPSIMRIAASDGETYYDPHISTTINDASIVAGIKGICRNNWNWDLSFTDGKNDFSYAGKKTFNTSMIGNTTKNHFDDGGFRFRQATVNIDFSKNFSNIAKGLNLAFGGEYRNEKYTISAGEEASYTAYPSPYDQVGGSQGFPGFSPLDTVTAKRHTFGFYADAELNITNKWLADAAIRFENYSDFGSVLTYKFATRYKIADNFNLRGSVSTGFRAPNLQQINFSNTLTNVIAGQLVQTRIINNNDPIARIAGIPSLKEETSVNGSVGFSWKPAKGLTVTLDGYMVKVKDRVVISGYFNTGDPSLPVELTNALNGLNVINAQFFANAVNTTNYGVDLIVDYSRKIGNGNFTALLAGNFQKVKIDEVNIPGKLNDSYLHRKTFFSDRDESFLKASAPKMKLNLSLRHQMKKFGAGITLNYFGNMETLGYGQAGLKSAVGTGGPGDPAISGSYSGIDPYVNIDGFDDSINVVKEVFKYKGKLTVDVFVSYKFCKSISLFLGADNIMNTHPDFAAVKNARASAYYNETNGAWEAVQMGFNGRRLFAKLAFNF